jgi:hypothetical protein
MYTNGDFCFEEEVLKINHLATLEPNLCSRRKKIIEMIDFVLKLGQKIFSKVKLYLHSSGTKCMLHRPAIINCVRF